MPLSLTTHLVCATWLSHFCISAFATTASDTPDLAQRRYAQAGAPNIFDLMKKPEERPVGRTTHGTRPSPVLTDPKGRPWPSTPAYIRGMPVLGTGGPSTLTIDNASGGADVYVKLCRDRAGKCDAMRHVFIPAGSTFTIENIRNGEYDVRYRDLSDGSLARSRSMRFREVVSSEGVRYSVVTLTLYRVSGGNTSFSQIDESAF